MERPMIDRLERRIDREVKARFGPGVAYGRALRHVPSIDAPPPVADEAREAVAGLPVTDGE